MAQKKLVDAQTRGATNAADISSPAATVARNINKGLGVGESAVKSAVETFAMPDNVTSAKGEHFQPVKNYKGTDAEVRSVYRREYKKKFGKEPTNKKVEEYLDRYHEMQRRRASGDY